MTIVPKAIVVVGSINTDLTIQVPHFAVAHETVLGDGNFVTTQGGKGANQACAAAAGGLAVHMVGKVGQDAFGEAAIAELKSACVDCTHVAQVTDASTGIATIFVDPEGNNSITVASGANAQMSAADVVAATDLIASASLMMLQLEIPLAAIVAAIEIANQHNTLVMLDPAPATQPLPNLEGVDFLTPNEIEAEAIVSIDVNSKQGPERIVQALRSRGATNIALTLGKQGCYIADKQQIVLIPAREVQAVDSTGAGDAFNGFLATALARGQSLFEAAQRASIAATMSVTQSGARGGLPSWEDVEKLLTG